MPRFCDDRRHSCVEPKAKSRNAAQFITPGITPKFRRPQVCRSPTLVVDVRCGSKYEKLTLSKFRPLCPIERTSMRRAAPSLMGQLRTMLQPCARSAATLTLIELVIRLNLCGISGTQFCGLRRLRFPIMKHRAITGFVAVALLVAATAITIKSYSSSADSLIYQASGAPRFRV